MYTVTQAFVLITRSADCITAAHLAAHLSNSKFQRYPVVLSHVLCCSTVLCSNSIAELTAEHAKGAQSQAAIMSDRETRLMARMRRQDEARRERRDRLTTYGLAVVVVTLGYSHYTNHGKLERACLFLLAAFGLYAAGVALAAMSAYSESVMRLPEPDSDGEDHDHSHFHAGSISSSDSEDDKNK